MKETHRPSIEFEVLIVKWIPVYASIKTGTKEKPKRREHKSRFNSLISHETGKVQYWFNGKNPSSFTCLMTQTDLSKRLKPEKKDTEKKLENN